MSLVEYTLSTGRQGFYDITGQVAEAVKKSGVDHGVAVVYCPHTTAGITINENADPTVVHDILLGLATAFPDQDAFRHSEGNSTAHLKASCVGASQMIPISRGALLLGTWQSVYFCEFDGPRNRRYQVTIL